MFDTLIRNVKIIDGSGNAAFLGHVAIKDGKIAFVGKDGEHEANRYIDGGDLCLAPGFIDAHAHFDVPVLMGDHVNFCKLSQGVTTEISGNCGIGLAPVSPKYLELWKTFLVRSTGSEVPGILPELTSYDVYFKKLDQLNLAFNAAYHMGQGTIRTAVMGFENRKATAKEMEMMKEHIRNGMENGMIGLSTALIFAPGSFTPFEELVELCKVVASYGGIYATHIRNEANHVLAAIEEAIEIGRQSGVSVQISHFKACGKCNWGMSSKMLAAVEKAKKEGVEVFVDMYPYTSGNTPLNFIIPPRYMQQGVDKMVEILQDKKRRPEVAEEMLHPQGDWDSYLLNCGYEGVLIMGASKTPDAIGKTILQYAQEKDIDPMDAIFDILIENNGAGVAAWFYISEDDLQNNMRAPYVMFGTDGVPVPEGATTHPRIIGTFPRILGRYVRELGVLSLEEAVRKMTSLPAKRFGLKNKGLIKEGYDADLVLFRAESINESATYTDCFAKNQGIEKVIVKGQVVIENNQFTGKYPGRVIRVNKN